MASYKYKNYLKNLRNASKKGSTYKTKNGEIKPRSDFKRGEAMGKYKNECKRAVQYKKRKAK